MEGVLFSASSTVQYKLNAIGFILKERMRITILTFKLLSISLTVIEANAFAFPASLQHHSHSLLQLNSDTGSLLRQSTTRTRISAAVQSTSGKGDTTSADNEKIFDIPSLEDGITCGGRDMITHVKLLDRSLTKLSAGCGIYERMNIPRSKSITDEDIYQSICRNERYILISHGTEESPIYNFGNIACLKAFARSWENQVSMPSSESVVCRSQDEASRIELMQSVTDYGIFDGKLNGYRVRDDGKFIKLTEGVVWNCYEYGDDEEKTYIGQAAFFDTHVCPIVESTDEESDNMTN